jgi:acyl-CoA thioester hydrolase
MAAFVHHRIVEFHETDAAGLVHFSNYFCYAEAAEHALYRAIGYPIIDKDGISFYGWPRVRAQAKFSAPIDSGDELRIELSIQEIKDKAIDYVFRIFRLRDNTLAGKGSFTTMHVHIDGATRAMRAIAIPPNLREKLTPFVINDKSPSK